MFSLVIELQIAENDFFFVEDLATNEFLLFFTSFSSEQCH